MDEMKLRIFNAVAGQFAAAPDTAAKKELIEELSDNLYRRYQDMLASGMEPDAAFARAMDDLGDVDELLAYLKGLSPDGPQPGAGRASGAGQEWDSWPGKEEFNELIDSVGGILRSAMSQASDALRQAKAAMEQAERSSRREPGTGPAFSGVNARFEPAPDGGYVVSTDKPLRGVDVQTVNGDVTVYLLDGEDEPVRLGGDVDQLEVKVTDDGVLAVRQGRTASSSIFFLRGLTSADVELYLPRRRWEYLQVSATNGDVALDSGMELGRLSVRTASGDLRADLRECGQLYFKSSSGDAELAGLTGSVQAETASGDVRLSGCMDRVRASSASGDVEVDGSVRGARLSSMSGDVRLESSCLPEEADLSSKSGDCELRIPGAPFSVKFKTVSGDIRSDFFEFTGSGRDLSFDYQGGGQCYYLNSVSGDLQLLSY